MRIGEGGSIELPDYVGAMNNFLGLLRDVDSTVSEKKNGNLKWIVTTLNKEPAPLIGVTPRIHRPTISDTSVVVEREVIGNFVSLTERGERSRYLSDSALTKVEKIARTARKVGSTEIYTTKRGDFELRTTVSLRTLSQVQELTQERSLSYGFVVGDLGSISVHKGMEFRVWDENTKRPVTCKFPRTRLAEVTNRLGQRVVVAGMIRCDRNGLPLSVFVEELDGAHQDHLPPIADLMGAVPNLTEGMSLKEYFEDNE